MRSIFIELFLMFGYHNDLDYCAELEVFYEMDGDLVHIVKATRGDTDIPEFILDIINDNPYVKDRCRYDWNAFCENQMYEKADHQWKEKREKEIFGD